MPGPPSWKSDTVTLKEAPDEPQTLYWRDPVEFAHFLFQNPDFDGDMAYAPSWVFSSDGAQVYSEMMMGNEWHFQQSLLDEGSTILGIILASDWTHLTSFTGDKKMHAIYISLGNISKNVCWKHNMCAWLLLAKVPICKFPKTPFPGNKTEQKAIPGILGQ
ncbi:uncharacterized protein EI90DRAFT_3132592 [Cantharellus anzutake]|uniref:uncharacterized protein n=1 Tax=Cantharellus anzutake TaxID=1750568 RepID=UPI0019079EBC|nr:uncharacterized protein EI90DRAFT_3132592 [Cantharellus anzutake]KAF8319480.1 hypothetical protein EI90DRAFT_3132592 [Cantharellus anzutake]